MPDSKTTTKTLNHEDHGQDILVDFDMIDAVNSSWQIIKKIPNYEHIAGEILFRKIFEIAPVALTLYPFGADYKGREEELYKSKAFIRHAKGVVRMLDEAVNMLGPDMDPVTVALTELGARHVNYGVVPAHYAIVGQALLYTLEAALGKTWKRPFVRKGWTAVYSFVSTAMIAGANRQLKLVEKRNNRIRQKIENAREIRNKQQQTSSGMLRTRTKKQREPVKKKRNNAEDIIATVPGLKHNRRQHPTQSETLFKDKDQVLEVIDGVLGEVSCCDTTIDGDSSSVTSDLSASERSSSSSSTQKEVVEESYQHVIENVYQSWDKIKAIPNYEEVAGVLLFQKIFDIAPAAKALYSFYNEDDPCLEGEAFYEHPAFVKHAVGVVRMLDAAVNMLGPDLDLVASVLEGLGARHVAYGVIPDHYPIVGQALLATLEAALGKDGWTEDVKMGWTTIFSFVSSTMIKGANDHIDAKLRKSAETNSGALAGDTEQNLVAFQLLRA